MDEYLEEKKKEEDIEIIKKKDEYDKKVEKLKKFIKPLTLPGKGLEYG
jgi:hypothetical protein